jgi:hypothetical protein
MQTYWVHGMWAGAHTHALCKRGISAEVPGGLGARSWDSYFVFPMPQHPSGTLQQPSQGTIHSQLSHGELLTVKEGTGHTPTSQVRKLTQPDTHKLHAKSRRNAWRNANKTQKHTQSVISRVNHRVMHRHSMQALRVCLKATPAHHPALENSWDPHLACSP